DQIPEQVKATPRTANFPKGHHRKPAFKQITPVVFCPETPATPETPEIKGIKRGEFVIEDCVMSKIPLICESPDGTVLVNPPDFKAPTACASEAENGHIPSWLFDKLASLESFSDHLRSCIRRNYKTYQKKVRHGDPDYDSEAEVLIKLLQDIRKG